MSKEKGVAGDFTALFTITQSHLCAEILYLSIACLAIGPYLNEEKTKSAHSSLHFNVSTMLSLSE